jgi:hypothetical protein
LTADQGRVTLKKPEVMMTKTLAVFFAFLAPLTAGLSVAGVSHAMRFETATPLSSGPGSFLLLGAGLLAMYVTTSKDLIVRVRA